MTDQSNAPESPVLFSDSQLPHNRSSKISGAMIEHAASILLIAGTDFTHRDEDGYSQICIDCVADCIRSNWGNTIRKPLTHLRWRALGNVALGLIWTEADVERDEATINLKTPMVEHLGKPMLRRVENDQ